MIEIGELTNEKVIAHLKRYQKNPLTPHFTCNGNSDGRRCRKDLIPIERKEKIVLVCPHSECDYSQEFMMQHPVLKIDLDALDESLAKIEEAVASVRDVLLKRGFYAFTCTELEWRLKRNFPDADPFKRTETESLKLPTLLLYWIEAIRQMDTSKIEDALKASRFIGCVLACAKTLNIIDGDEIDAFVDVDIYHGTHLPRA